MAESVYRWTVRHWQFVAYVVTLTATLTLSWAKFQTRADVERIAVTTVQGPANAYVIDQALIMRVVQRYDQDLYAINQSLHSIQVTLGTLVQLQKEGSQCER